MTAPDPRVGEIAARLAKKPGVQGMYSFHGSDVAYLLAQLRERDAKLARVEALHVPNGAYWPGGLADGEYCKHDRKPWPCPTRAAVAAATGDGE